MSEQAFLPPRPVIRFAWRAHRALFRWSNGRLGLREYTIDEEGLAELTTIGRKSGKPRPVMIAYFTDGDDYVTLAMNGWDPAEPQWWLNLLADERGTLTLPHGKVDVIARAAAEGEEHDRLWQRWRELDNHTDRQSYRRPGGTAVVILSPVATTSTN